MDTLHTRKPETSTAVALALPAGAADRTAGSAPRTAAATRVLRNAYALLAMTLLFFAGVVALGVAL